MSQPQVSPSQSCSYCSFNKVVSMGFTTFELAVPGGRANNRPMQVFECQRCHLVTLVGQPDDVLEPREERDSDG